MFCPNCGKADQKENSYCRQCGEFLPSLRKKKLLPWGGETPEKQIRISFSLNLISAIACLIFGVLLLSTHGNPGDTTFVVTVAAVLLFINALWQIWNFIIGLKRRKHLKKRHEDEEIEVEREIYLSPKTKELLPEAHYQDIVPPSITEDTTKNLTEKVNRLSQAEK